MESFEVPTWTGNPPAGLHLDVYKDDKFVQKIMIDGKKCYLFGRNPELNDFGIEHSSCSRVHAALIYHKHFNLTYLVDLNSANGTFIGQIKLESHKPTVIQLNSSFHFGQSTRYYTLREGLKAHKVDEDLDDYGIELPESQEDMDNLTEYNTVHNRKIIPSGVEDVISTKKGKRKMVQFNEKEEILNPQDVDPLIKAEHHKHILLRPLIADPCVYDESPSTSIDRERMEDYSKFTQSFPNPFTESDYKAASCSMNQIQFRQQDQQAMSQDSDEPKKKKYAKETWFGPKKAPKLYMTM